ncbi:MAG: hypothetical protein LBH32_11240 [Dysgonamonadaceae bacterium]|jgi:flagellar biosynthesis GTPase FlhF|nr:hypothetical protein [Dysgonamonadaceae bacterium]
MNTRKFLIITCCLLLSATYAGAQNIKQDLERKKQQEIQRRESIKAEAERQKRLQAEREEAARIAEQERQKREEWKRLGIPDVTKDNLIENASCVIYEGYSESAQMTKEEKERSKSPNWGRGGIKMALTLDVYAWNKLKYDDDSYAVPYETELKRKIYEESDEYNEKLNDLKVWRSRLLQSVLFAKIKHGYGGIEMQYDMKQGGFKVHTHQMRSNPIDKELLDGFIFNTLPVTGDDDTYLTNGTQFFWLKVDKETAAEIENNEDIRLYVFFMLNGKIKNESWTGTLFYVDKVRVVLTHQRTGKIYYDQSFPEGCLPIAKQETMSAQEYLAYQAEQQRIAAEKKTEERRREKERMQEEQRKEQEKIEAAKRAEQEKIEAEKRKLIEKRREEIEKNMSFFTFENDNIFQLSRKTIGSASRHGSLWYEGKQPEIFNGDAPNGKGNSLLLGKKSKIRLNHYATFSVWIKNEGKENACYFTENVEIYNSQFYTSDNKKLSEFIGTKSQLIYKSNEKSVIVVSYNPFMDRQWHLLTVVRNENVNEQKFYIDGKLVNTAEISFPIKRQQNITFQLQMSGKGGEIKIDNLRYNDLPLTDEEVAAIYEEERGK